MQDDICCFKSPGISPIVMHKSKAYAIFKLVQTNEAEEDIDATKLADKVKSEMKQLNFIKDDYLVLSSEEMLKSCCPTLITFVSLISSEFTKSKVAVLISNIITGAVTSMLQVSLGLLVQKKQVIDHLHEYGVTASYDEIRRFKISAPAASTKQEQSIRLKSGCGLIQGVSDNFDATLSTQNGLKQTHSLATIITQNGTANEPRKHLVIPRLKKENLSTVKLRDTEIKTYTGEKKTEMPRTHALVGVLPLRLLCHQVIITRKSMEDGFAFIKTSLTKSDIPDYVGYNTENAGNNGKSKVPKTNILYRPLINKTLSDPSTVLTSMIDVESISKDAGQSISVFTCDQQIYRVAINIIWDNPTFILKLVVCIG